jgi:hypothetical protein
VKSFQRLDYERLAEALKERKLVEGEALRHILHQCNSTGAPLPDLLVREGLVADWELCRVCCELFHLPFLPLNNYEPDPDLFKSFDVELLRQYALVPMDRFGDLVTLAMPGMVPTDVLKAIEEEQGVKVLAVVSSVQSNHQWIEQHLPAPNFDAFGEAAEDSEWTNILDMGEQAVTEELVAHDLEHSPALDETSFREVIDFDAVPDGAIELDAVDGALPAEVTPEEDLSEITQVAEAEDFLNLGDEEVPQDPPSLRLSIRRPPSTED